MNVSVNGIAHELESAPLTPLLDVLREELGITGPKAGCLQGGCGACTVLVDGEPRRSCLLPSAYADGGEITTVEGLASADGKLHPMQEAFRDCHGLQCGFCTPGMVMSAIDLVQRQPGADERAIREGLEGNLCRCTGYHNIVRAVQQGAAAMAEGKTAKAPAAKAAAHAD